MEGYSFCTSAKIVSDINKMKHIYVTCFVLCYVIYVMLTFSVCLGPKTQNIPTGKVSSDTSSVVLKWRKKEKLHQWQDIVSKQFFSYMY
jgi:hypothetical protein